MIKTICIRGPFTREPFIRAEQFSVPPGLRGGGARRGTRPGPQSLIVQFLTNGGVTPSLDPTPGRDVVDGDVPIDHEFLKIAEAEPESEIPSDAHDDDLSFKVASLEHCWPVPSHPTQAYQTTSTAFATLPEILLNRRFCEHQKSNGFKLKRMIGSAVNSTNSIGVRERCPRTCDSTRRLRMKPCCVAEEVCAAIHGWKGLWIERIQDVSRKPYVE